MAIGRPISLTPNIATKNISSLATANQTEFTVTGGYRINEIAVYRNGVRLAQGRDFTASDGTTVNLTNGATVSDVIEFSVFDSFNVAGTIVSVASSQDLGGDLNVTGKLYGGTVDTDSLKIGVGTFVSAIHVGTAITIDAAGNTNTTGIVTAASFSGDGSNLTNVGMDTSNVVSVATTTGNLTVSAAATIGGIVNIDATTDSTSTSTGALIVDGGLGVAKNVYIGAGLSVAGTLTYEDVTSVDSVGLITAKSGVNITGGELTVGSGITMGIAGVATFSGTSDVHLLDNVKLNVGDASDFQVSHDGSDTILNNTTGALKILSDQTISFRDSGDSEAFAVFTDNGSVDLYYNNSKKFETTNDGTVTTGISTADGFSVGDNEYISVGVGSDLVAYHDGTHTYITNTSGDLRITDTGGGGLIIGSNSLNLRNSARDENYFVGNNGGSAEIYFNNNKKFETTNSGTITTGISTVTVGTDLKGFKVESGNYSGGSLNGEFDFTLEDGHVWTVVGSTAGTYFPDFKVSSSQSLSSIMNGGDTVTATLIVAASNTAHYCTAGIKIDDSTSNVTIEWIGSAAPTAGKGAGYDIYTFTIMKTAATPGYLVIVNATDAG